TPIQKIETVAPSQGRTLESYEAVAKEAMVVTPNAQASQIGLEVLQKGGNAADAAIAISFALSVLRPQSTGLGGGGFLLFYDKNINNTIAIDFREFAPSAASRDMFLKNGVPQSEWSRDGALSVAVPRLVAGLGFIYERYASRRIPWRDLVLPSAQLAVDGFPVYPALAKAIEERKELLSRFPSSKKIFLKGDAPLREGDLLIQRDLAVTLKLIAGGWQNFYIGAIPSKIVASVRSNGGILRYEDFRNVSPTELKPVEGTYRGYKIVSMPPPSSGGTILIEILNILENFPLEKQGPVHLKTIHVVTEAMKRAFIDRAKYMGDPRFVKVPVRGLTSKEYAKSLAESINRERATPSIDLDSSLAVSLPESNSTTHFSLVDAEGNAVASTQTINYYFGSGLTAEGTGVVLNDEMDDFSIAPGVPNVFGLVGGEANAIAPGKIPLSSMSPTLVFDEEGELNMVLGSPGGPKIITAVLNTLINRIDFEETPLRAVAAKRYHHQWLPDQLLTEPGLLPDNVKKELLKMGHRIEEGESSWLVMLVARTKKGWIGVTDPRGVGVPMGY
ncbi:MAG: gamma-glutamyltransferase, partial [Deltaproteobacteria bacterium]|nr:gamma-glutamyltransferase [Deltaproteobacteria bacterium]